ncbi:MULTISPECIES: RHS repeat-associated core domain-containing protein [unclassified Pseudoalteromonas]|uniref:RHS repeat-associated core domain-containing protein n=1 Tax=unclassified Pseudoalteromonas TaxID=194690 RepID=UPI0030155186
MYDDLNRLTNVYGGNLIGKSTITYDGLGNIETYKSKDTDLAYSYNRANNRLSSITGTGTSGKYGNIQYDVRGNIKHNGAFGLSYNAANQMVSAKGNTFLYDGHNRRVKQVEAKGTSYSFYSQDGTLLYREKGDTLTGEGINYIYLGEKLIAKTGNVIPISTADSRQHYRPFGETLEEAKDDVGYTGHKFDKELGLSYMQARYYDPVIGRFYSNDPIDAYSHLDTENGIHGFNRYAYANNNPYKYTDPTGMSSYGAQRMSVTMAPNSKAAKANHASHTAPRSGSDTVKIAAGAALAATGNIPSGVILMGEGLSGESLSKEVASAITDDPKLAENLATTGDFLTGVKGVSNAGKNILKNIGSGTGSMTKGAIAAGGESAVLANDINEAVTKKNQIEELDK